MSFPIYSFLLGKIPKEVTALQRYRWVQQAGTGEAALLAGRQQEMLLALPTPIPRGCPCALWLAQPARVPVSPCPVSSPAAWPCGRRG